MASFSAFKYGHNARPDMLYAFWTTAVLAVWLALREVSPRQARYGAWAMWLLFALATLTKGPQAPAIMLGGAVVYEGLFGTGWRAVWRRLHAVAALLLVDAALSWGGWHQEFCLGRGFNVEDSKQKVWEGGLEWRFGILRL